MKRYDARSGHWNPLESLGNPREIPGKSQGNPGKSWESPGKSLPDSSRSGLLPFRTPPVPVPPGRAAPRACCGPPARAPSPRPGAQQAGRQPCRVQRFPWGTIGIVRGTFSFGWIFPNGRAPEREDSSMGGLLPGEDSSQGRTPPMGGVLGAHGSGGVLPRLCTGAHGSGGVLPTSRRRRANGYEFVFPPRRRSEQYRRGPGEEVLGNLRSPVDFPGFSWDFPGIVLDVLGFSRVFEDFPRFSGIFQGVPRIFLRSSRVC